MAFDTQTVTIKGAELLAAATAADPLIIVGCDATQTYLTQAQAVNVATRPATPFSTTTSVTQLGSTAEHINSRVYFRAGDNTGGDANTLMLYGHKQSAPSDNYVIFVASAQTPFHLPEVGDVVDEWETALDITYNIATNAVGYATQATYCTLSEFNLLKERTVTTHKEGYPTTGENQTIYGTKTFTGDVGIGGFLQVSDFIRGNNGCGIDDGITINSGGLEISETGLTSDWEFKAVVSYNAVGPIITFGFPNYSGSGHVPEMVMTGDTASKIEFNTDSVIVGALGNTGNVLTINGDMTITGNIIANATNQNANFYYVNIDRSLSLFGSSSVSKLNNNGLAIHNGSTAQTNNRILYASTGDNKTIIGNSTNDSALEINGTLSTTKAATLGASGNTGNTLTVNGDMTITGDITANATNQNANFYFVNVYSLLSLFGSSSRSRISNDGLSVHNGPTAQVSNRIFCVSTGDNKTIIGNSTNDSALEINGTLSTTKAATLGTVGNAGTILNVNGMSNFTKIVTIGVSGDTANRLYVYGATYCEGTISTGSATISGSATITGNLTASTSGTTATFNDVVISGTISAAGLAPNLSSSTLSIPIGGIVGIYAVGNGNMGTITVGQSKTISANQFKPCRWDVDSGAWTEDQYYVPAGTYKALTGFVDSINAGTAGPVFFIRVA